jgi:hypothetical protein
VKEGIASKAARHVWLKVIAAYLREETEGTKAAEPAPAVSC